ncbi:MAG: hypothetical protein HY088_01250 [Ignavibacteriales bacterium]|nr:hypothetical protein [Ignavibacteriales bacterium]
MDKKRISSIIIFIGGALIFFMGIAHALGISSIKESLSQHSTLTQSRQNQILINWVFSGAAISALGLIAFLLAPQVRRGKKFARDITALIGVFFLLISLIAYLIEPDPRLLLVFTFPALLLLMPMIFFRKEFTSD